jgi:2-oxoglutarate dehydrogenase E1 component
MCAEHNIQVCVPTTPAQVYHMLRRQVIRPLRKPLIVMSPKSLLRHKQAVSTMEELAEGSFQTVIGETDQLADNTQVKRAVLCSGKVYYDLYNKREAEELENIAIIRLEQLYPFPADALSAELANYPNLETLVWCQDEPQNQGAWYSSQHHMRRVLSAQSATAYLEYAGREASASPAAGYMALHLAQQNKLINDALGLQ